jgi:hypothetical protein
MWEAGFEVVDCPGAFVEHYEGANRAVRKSNRALLARDREAYRQRWESIFWDPSGPDLRDRVEIEYDDPHQTARGFPDVRPSLVDRVRRRALRSGGRALTRLTGLVHA